MCFSVHTFRPPFNLFQKRQPQTLCIYVENLGRLFLILEIRKKKKRKKNSTDFLCIPPPNKKNFRNKTNFSPHMIFLLLLPPLGRKERDQVIECIPFRYFDRRPPCYGQFDVTLTPISNQNRSDKENRARLGFRAVLDEHCKMQTFLL